MKPLILWGGVDIHPDWYDRPPSKFLQQSNHLRDKHEFELVEDAVKNGIPCIGVCRGAQLLCIYNGGELYQHSEGHNQSHMIYTLDHKRFVPAADHHQIMYPKGLDYVVYAYDPRSTKVWIDDNTTKELACVPEVIWYPKTKCLCIQPHPEWENEDSPFVAWCNSLIEKLMGIPGGVF